MTWVRKVCEGFDGSNCTLGGQPLLSLTVNESALSDYDTAAAVCLASSPHDLMDTVTTYEGGVDTGQWTVEEARTIKSGDKRTAVGHIPMVSYKLKRVNWRLFRAPLSSRNLGDFLYPPKFMSENEYRRQQLEFAKTASLTTGVAKQPPWTGYRIVNTGEEIIRIIASWFNLPIYYVPMPYMAKQYVPSDQTILGAIKEIAGWNGFTPYLRRDGTLTFFRIGDTFAGTHWNGLSFEFERETVQSIPDTTLYKIVGDLGFGRDDSYWTWEELASQGKPKDYWYTATAAVPHFGNPHVEARREISDYKRDAATAGAMARNEIEKALLASNYVRVRGVAEGYTGLRVLQNGISQLQRQLNWDGTYYSYEIDLTYANFNTPVTVTYPVAEAIDGPYYLWEYLRDRQEEYPEDGSFEDWWESSLWYNRYSQYHRPSSEVIGYQL